MSEPRRIAVLSDIHGNVPALEAVLDDLAGQAVDEVLVGGDLVGRGPQGSRVTRRIRELGFPAIGGNHEDYLLDFRRGDIPDHWRTSTEWSAARFMAAELDDEDVRYLEDLPFSIKRPGLEVVHGSPRSNREGIGPWTSTEELQEHLERIDAKILICAHTHRPLVREVAAGLVVNIGSVGLPFNRDHRAQYAIFKRGGRWGWRVELRQVAYELQEIFDVYERTGFLTEGGVTARLLKVELEVAAPVLVPFLEWSKARGVAPDLAELDEFFRFHPPGSSLRGFFERLRALD